MGDFRASIPGWLDAVNLESLEHDNAYIFPHDGIAGVAVRHLTLVDIYRMQHPDADNELFKDRFPTFIEFSTRQKVFDDTVNFLWYQSLEYDAKSLIKKMLFRRKIQKIDFSTLYSELREFIARTYMDAIGSSGRMREINISYWSDMTGFIDLMGIEYGWTREETLDTPYRQLIQIVRKIMKRKDPKKPIGSISDDIATRHMLELDKQKGGE